MKYFFLSVGMVLMLLTLYIMFQPAGFTDKHLVMSLFSGTMFTFIGFLIEAYNTKPYTRFQAQHRRKQINSSITVTIMSATLTMLAFFFF